MDAQLPVNTLEVRLGGTDRDTELVSDLLGGGSLGHEAQHLPLPLTEQFVEQLVAVRPPLLGELCYILSGSQRSQRGFLRLSEAGHAADVQVLVGPLASKCFQTSSCPRIPQLDRLILTSASKYGARRTDGH